MSQESTRQQDDPNGAPGLLGRDRYAVWVWERVATDPQIPKELAIPNACWKTIQALRRHWTEDVYADGDGSGCFATVETLASYIRSSARTVQGDLKRLEDLGWIRTVTRLKQAGKSYERQPDLPRDPRVVWVAHRWRSRPIG